MSLPLLICAPTPQSTTGTKEVSHNFLGGCVAGHSFQRRSNHRLRSGLSAPDHSRIMKPLLPKPSTDQDPRLQPSSASSLARVPLYQGPKRRASAVKAACQHCRQSRAKVRTLTHLASCFPIDLRCSWIGPCLRPNKFVHRVTKLFRSALTTDSNFPVRWTTTQLSTVS